jgi:hypothetical protein
MKSKIILWSASILLLSFGCSPEKEQSKETRANAQASVMSTSDYIFQGKIVEGKNIELPMNVERSNVKVVRVEKVISSSDGHENFEGQSVQVVFNENEKISSGKSYVFYTKTWLFGKTLTVVANTIEAEFNVNEIIKEVDTYKKLEQDKKIQERLKRAEFVIIGKVQKIKPFNSSKERTKLSEHMPLWEESTIEVVEVLKGNNTSKTIQVLYASSQDIHWYESPKLTTGQQRIYILDKKEEFQITKGNYVLTKADESYPISQENKIKQLLKN